MSQHLREDVKMLALALALPVDFSPPLMLAYFGRSENQHFSYGFLTEEPASLFFRHQFFGILGDVRSRDTDLSELIVAHV